jgi:hypothetical protein
MFISANMKNKSDIERRRLRSMQEIKKHLAQSKDNSSNNLKN